MAVLKEFEAISERGGVLGAMETGYQRGKIQEESMYYEHKKHDGSYPIIGVNTFRNAHAGDAPSLHAPPVLPPHLEQRMRDLPQRADLHRVHQHLEDVLVVDHRLLEALQHRPALGLVPLVEVA